ncbi:hypothetical protein ACIREE_28025 [Streptomyces sp. NPDC102467]|uniref:hypothetical protein n=1 Tax=Streptomyces sp. NPDC102467 TaxID=3366179 RepID=UPI00381E667C
MRALLSRLTRRVKSFLRPTGRHRIGSPVPAPHAIPSPQEPCIASTVRAWYAPIDGGATRLIRPYLVAYEHEESARLQRLRRDTLWCATYGIDLDARNIHDALEAA